MREVLLHYYKYKPGTVGCEVGVWQGQFSSKLFFNLKPSKLYLVDPWIVRPDYTKRWYSTDSIDQKTLDKIYQNVVNKFQPFEQVTIIRDLFQNTANIIPDNSLDWIYIDGDHSEEEVFNDLKLSLKKVKTSGYITGDDFSWVDPSTEQCSVKNALEKFLEKFSNRIKLLTIHNNQFVIKKL